MRWLLGRGIDARPGSQLDTAIAAYLHRPGRRPLRARPTCSQRYTPYAAAGRRRRVAGPARLRRRRRRRSTRRRPRARWPSATCSPALRVGARQAGHGRAVRDDREPAGRRAGRDGARRHRRRHRRAAAAQRAPDVEVERLGAELQRVVGRPFNLNSPVQLREILYTETAAGRRRRRPRPATRPTRRRWRSCATQWPEFIDPLLQYREVEKLRGTYGRACSPRSRPTGGSTPRSTRPWPAPVGSVSDQPNLHNIPVRTRRGPAVPQGVRPRRRAARCSSPTTTRSSCAASPTSPPTRA